MIIISYYHKILSIGTRRIFHQSPMQMEKSQAKGKWLMLEARFTLFQALSVDLRVEISLPVTGTDD